MFSKLLQTFANFCFQKNCCSIYHLKLSPSKAQIINLKNNNIPNKSKYFANFSLNLIYHRRIVQIQPQPFLFKYIIIIQLIVFNVNPNMHILTTQYTYQFLHHTIPNICFFPCFNPKILTFPKHLCLTNLQIQV